MLGIKAGSEFLELNPGTQLELQQDNPFLQITDEITGDQSMPFEIKCTPHNMRLLNHPGLLQKRLDNNGQDVTLYDTGLQHSIGKLKIEKPSIHLNHTAKGTISMYYLSGVSSFYQDIKDLKMRSVDYGGDRVFNYDGWATTGNGFWGHIHDVINGRVTEDYGFFPVIDASFTSNDLTDILNRCKPVGSGVEFERAGSTGISPNAIVPFPKLSYVLKRIMAQVGWTMVGDLLNDPDFNRIEQVNFRAMDWAWIKRISNSVHQVMPYNVVVFNLRDHVPDILVSEFLINLKNRLGLWYDFDRKNKVITVRKLTSVLNGEVKDFTRQASPVVVKTVNQQRKIYALKNNFTGEYADGQPDLASIDYRGTVQHPADLGTPTEGRYGQVYLTIQDNNYYICRQNEFPPYGFIWGLYAYNVYDLVPAGATDEVTTTCTTLGNERYSEYCYHIPRMEYNGHWPYFEDGGDDWNTILCFNYGIRLNPSGQPLPFGSSGIYDMHGVQIGQWSLAFSCKKMDGTEAGLYDTAWKDVLAIFSGFEDMEVTLHLSRTDYLNLSFSNIICIKNVRFYIKQIKAVIPYKNAITIEGVRI